MNIAVASCNPVKIEAVNEAFLECFSSVRKIEGFNVSSGVPDQPIGDEITRKGAENRVSELQEKCVEFDWFVGIEGGIEQQNGQMTAFAWIVVKSGSKSGVARTATFYLPPRVAQLVQQGYELGDANDLVFEKHNSKQKNGAVGLLTNNIIDRKQLYRQAVILALIPFMNNELYLVESDI